MDSAEAACPCDVVAAWAAIPEKWQSPVGTSLLKIESCTSDAVGPGEASKAGGRATAPSAVLPSAPRHSFAACAPLDMVLPTTTMYEPPMLFHSFPAPVPPAGYARFGSYGFSRLNSCQLRFQSLRLQGGIHFRPQASKQLPNCNVVVTRQGCRFRLIAAMRQGWGVSYRRVHASSVLFVSTVLLALER